MEQAFGIAIPRSLEHVCNPRDMALLVYDMQVGIVNQVKDGQGLVSRVSEILEAARRAHLRVFFTRHMSLPLELMGSFQYRMAMAWQRVDHPDHVKSSFLRESPGFAIVRELEPRRNEAIFDKLTMSAFEGTPLLLALRDCAIRALAICGLALEVGIEPTARHAADCGIIPVLVRDACGWGNEEAAARSLASLEFAGDTIVTDRAILRELLAATAPQMVPAVS